MAKYERRLTGDFDSLLETLHQGILRGSVSATFQDGSNIDKGGVRCAVRVYERFSQAGGSRVAANVTLLGDGNKLFLSIITAGGSRATFFKINTWGEHTFLEKIVKVVDDWERG